MVSEILKKIKYCNVCGGLFGTHGEMEHAVFDFNLKAYIFGYPYRANITYF